MLPHGPQTKLLYKSSLRWLQPATALQAQIAVQAGTGSRTEALRTFWAKSWLVGQRVLGLPFRAKPVNKLPPHNFSLQPSFGGCMLLEILGMIERFDLIQSHIHWCCICWR